MSLTLKQMLDEVMRLTGLEVKAAYADEGTAEVERLVTLANEAATSLKQLPWRQLRVRYDFTLTTATEYDLPDDFQSFIPNTMYTGNHVWPADFPAETGFWSYLQATSGGSGARYHMRLLGEKLHVFQPDSGQDVSFEYITNAPVLDTDGITKQEFFDADTDTFILDDWLLIKDVVWRHKELLGLPFETDLAKYRTYLTMKLGKDKSAQTLYPNQNQVEIGSPYYNLWRPVPNV